MLSAPADPPSTIDVTPSLEKHRRRQVGRGDVHVEIDQSWRDDLSARVDDI